MCKGTWRNVVKIVDNFHEHETVTLRASLFETGVFYTAKLLSTISKATDSTTTVNTIYRGANAISN